MIDALKGIARELRREHGLTVKVVPGWKERGRPYPFAPRAVFEHHTASNEHAGNTPSLGIVTNGRGVPGTPDFLPGPLANFVIGRDGTIVIVAAGRCNHAGEGGPLKGIPQDSGNMYAFGIEIENNGVGEEYPAEQKRAAAILTAVLLERVGARKAMAIGHREWTPRKIDPSFGMNAFRQRVGKILARFR